MKRRVLITGITGFVGGYLARALLEQRAELFGLCRGLGWGNEDSDLAAHVHFLSCDLCESPRVEAFLRETRPEQVYHLAGYADQARSHREPDAAWAANLDATRSLYDALLRCELRPRILFVSSGAIYGEPSDPTRPIDESTELLPNSPYAASKAAADLAGYQYFRSARLPIVRARPFNHIGPRQSPHYAVANFARQIAAIERDEQPPVLRTGNLNARRDLTDVRDVVRAYVLLMEKGEAGLAYNVGSGQSRSMRAILDHLLSLSSVSVKVETAAELARPADAVALTADNRRLRSATGWTPRFALEQTLADTLEYWRSVVG